MDYQSAINKCYQNGTLDLPATALAPSNAAQSLTQYTAYKGLKLTGVTEKTDLDQGQGMRLVGEGASLPFVDMAVTVEFRWTAGQAEVQLTATPKEGWNFGKSFPSLATGLPARLPFDGPTALTLTAAPAGLSFSGTLPTGMGELARYGFLLGSAGTLLAGPITYDDQGLPRLALKTSLGAPPALGFLELQPVDLILHIDSAYNSRTKSQLSTAYLEFATALAFTTHTPQPTRHLLPVSATLHDPASDIQLDADVTALVDAAVDELASLLNGNSAKNLLPSDFQLEEVVKLSDLNVQLNPSADNKLSAVRLQVDTTRSWVLAQDAARRPILELEGVQVAFGIRAPFGSEDLFLGLRGVVKVGNEGVIELSMAYPSMSFRGTLQAGTEIKLRELFTHILGYSSPAVPELSVVDLEVNLQPGIDYAVAVELDGDWQIPVGDGNSFAIEELKLAVDYNKTMGLLASFEGVVGFDNQFITLKADHPAADEGWIFAGGTAPGQVIDMQNLVADMEHFFGVEFPFFISHVQLKSLAASYATKTSDLSLSCETLLPLENVPADQWPDLTVDIALIHVNGKFEKTFKGRLLLAGRQFDLDFSTGGADTIFWGDYENTGGQELAVGDLLRLLTTDAELLAATQDLRFNLKDAFAGYVKAADEGAEAKWLLGLDMEFGADLTALPLVGQYIPKEEALRLVFQPRIATQEFAAADVTALKGLLAGSAISLPDTFSKGLLLHIELSLGTVVIPMALPIKLDQGQLADDPTKAPAPPADTPAAPAEKATWFNLQKSFGPLQLQRVGVQYEGGLLTFLLDGGFAVAGLSVSLMGLSASATLHPFELSFGLQGLGIDFKSGPVEIGGSFLARQYPDDHGGTYTEYGGLVQIKAEAFSLAAVGAYATYEGHPSLFVYGVLDEPLGGPAFFFVTGLAAGFGFNRALHAPGLDQVAQFPLVSLAAGGAGATKPGLAEMLAQLHNYIPPAVGEYFLAVGIKFTSFKIIDSFALLLARFGSDFELDLLGLSTLVLPAQTGGAVPPLAEVQMALKASFVPAIGFVGVEAKLTSASYLFSRDCHLTGGFAFYAWFAGPHQHDFAVTLGGYHPGYQRPGHYPVVDKLGFNWVISSQLSVKGDAYFALVPSAVMAGTYLSAVWEDDSLRAWFNAGADFVIAWKPYHYDATLHVDMGVSYTYELFGTHHISADASADLHLWGPEFAGQAHVHLWIVSFDVRFGSSSAELPAPISWAEFSQSFLPDHQTVCSLAVQQGLVKKQGDGADAHPVVNPKDLVLGFNTLVPLKSASLQTAAHATANLPLAGAATNWGVGPMDLAASAVQSEVVISAKRGDDYVTEGLRLEPVTKGVPVALWGQSVRPSLNGPRLVDSAACGLTIRCLPPKEPATTAFIDRAKLEFEAEDVPSPAWRWTRMPAFNATPAEQQLNEPAQETTRRDYLRAHLETVQAERTALLQQLGFGAPVFPDRSLADAFVVAPQFAEALS